ncbi:MAG: hypothetical protein NT085_05335 [candidate division SR1 bacterium]|nr:hypothetical protein [candidate division SR1 bacterium]
MKDGLDPIIQGQLDTIQKEGLRSNEQELNLPENTQIYTGLYENGTSREELARKIIDQWNINDGKDYFSDPEQIKKANSFANFIINDQATQDQIKLTQHTQDMEKRRNEIQQGQTMKMSDLKDLLQDKPENAKENTEIIIEKAKTRVMQTIDRYTNKIKDLGKANETEKEQLKKEIADVKEEIKKEKEAYEKAKKDFFSEVGNNFKDFSKEELKKLPVRLLRYKQREGLFNKPVGFNSISSIRRRKTINTLGKKMNEIGKDHTKGINFVMGFHKDRLGRYTDINISTMLHKIGSNIGLQMNPQQFHERFNRGRNEITAVLDNPNAGELSPDEKTKVDAIKNRINYYGATYAKERANVRVGPFIDAEKNATEKGKIIQMTPPSNAAKGKTIEMTPPSNAAISA